MRKGARAAKCSVSHTKGTWGEAEAPLPAAVGEVETTASLVVGRQGAEIASDAIAHLAPQSELSCGGMHPKGLHPQAHLDMGAGDWDPHALWFKGLAHRKGCVCAATGVVVG